MADIKFYDYVKDVELNRRRLIDNIKSKGLQVDANASLSEVVTTNNNIPLYDEEGKVRVRFFRGDGKLLKTEYVEVGGAVTPPTEDIDFDPEILTFKEWISGTGTNNFTNIPHALDFGAVYEDKVPGSTHIFCKFNERTGKDVTIQVNTSKTLSYIIDWGDGTIEEYTAIYTRSYSHSYEMYGQYTIHLKPNGWTPKDWFTDYSLLQLKSNSSLGLLGNTVTNDAIQSIYSYNLDTSTDYVIRGSYNIKYIINTAPYFKCYNYFYMCHVDFIVYNNPILIPYSNNTLHIGNSTGDYSSMSFCIFGGNIYYKSNSTYNPSLYISAGSLQDLFIVPKILNIGTAGGVSVIELRSASNSRSVKKLLYNYATETISFDYSVNSTDIYLYNTTNINNINVTCGFIYMPKVTTISSGYFSTSWFTTLDLSSNNGLICPKNLFNYCGVLKELYLPQNFNNSLDLGSTIVDNYVDILNSLKDNASETTSLILDFCNQTNHPRIKDIYVKLNNGLYEECESTDEGAISLIEAMQNKGWTISVW